MSFGGAGVTLQRQFSRQQEQFKARQEQTRIRQARRMADLEEDPSCGSKVGDEPMACPACRLRYPFGDSCPSCEQELVCASYVPEPQHPPTPTVLTVSDERVCGRCLKEASGESCAACGGHELLDPRVVADADYLDTLHMMRRSARFKRVAVVLILGLWPGMMFAGEQLQGLDVSPTLFSAVFIVLFVFAEKHISEWPWRRAHRARLPGPAECSVR